MLRPAHRSARLRLPFSPWHLVLIPLTFLLIVPLLWMLVTSLETEGEANRFPPVLLPESPRFENYSEAWAAAPFGHFFLNSALVTLVVLVSNLVVCSLAGYAFARIRFLGRGALFVTLMATLMVPFQVTMIPVFLIVKWFGDNVWAGLGIDHIGALMLPNLATAFGIFFLRQFFQTVPVELEEAARVDGTSRLGVLFKIVLPAVAARVVDAGRPDGAHVLERLPVAADRDHLAGSDDDSVGAQLLPGRTPGQVAAADGGQRDEPAADAARVHRSAAVFRPVGGQHRAEGLTDGGRTARE